MGMGEIPCREIVSYKYTTEAPSIDERLCCFLKIYDDLAHTLLIPFGKVEIPVRGVYDVVRL